MAGRSTPLDPRTGAAPVGEASVKPVVALRRAGPPTFVLIGGALIAALVLFLILDARRRSSPAPAVVARGADLPGSTLPPPLYVPPEPPPPVIVREPAESTVAPAPAPVPRQVVSPQIVYVPQPAAPAPTPPAPPARVTAEPALVIDTTVGQAGQAATAASGAAAGGGETLESATGTATLGARTRAGVLANRATTVPQGTLIPAVMETAFNSARPGFARAIVSRDIRGFDGSRVLIPRGSRLIGEYRSDATQGQKRALINWVRLVRPDGVTIAIGSPATDPLGGSGVRAKVNSHFFERFAGAILRSTVDIGVALASRAGSSGVVVVPGTLQGGTEAIAPPTDIRPTLTVARATSISVFVARDLDFTGVEGRR